jgi:hypothetical protein
VGGTTTVHDLEVEAEAKPGVFVARSFEAKPGDFEAKPGDVEAKPGDVEAKPGDVEAGPFLG